MDGQPCGAGCSSVITISRKGRALLIQWMNQHLHLGSLLFVDFMSEKS
jgi:hypothetical protein